MTNRTFTRLLGASVTSLGWLAAGGPSLYADDRSDLKALVDAYGVTVRGIREANSNDPRLYFLDAQKAILDGMLASAWFRTRAQEMNWLLRVTRRFMTSLERALAGQIARKSNVPAENAVQWRKVLNGELGGFWWGSAFKDCEDRARTFQPQPWPAPQLDEWFATAYMIAHIDFDLRMALLTEGVGSDEAFAEVGRLVQSAWDARSRHPRSLIEFGTQHHPLLRSLDPMRRRTRVREKVKAWLASQNVTSAWSGFTFQGIPDGSAFAGSGTADL